MLITRNDQINQWILIQLDFKKLKNHALVHGFYKI